MPSHGLSIPHCFDHYGFARRAEVRNQDFFKKILFPLFYKVTLTSWPLLIFDMDFRLKSLSFIDVSRHFGMNCTDSINELEKRGHFNNMKSHDP